MSQEVKYVPLGGGLDLVTPPIAIPSGRLIAAVNYESAADGYQRLDGFERFDGLPKPSDASYWVINFDNGTAAISEDDQVTGATSSATGKALIDAVITSGTYGGGDAAGYLVLTGVTGTFVNDENLQVSAVTKSIADGTATELGASNDTDDKTWLQDAIETARALISAVPGSGPVRGVWVYKGVTYAFRDNAGGTAGVMHKATAAGWTAVSLGLELAFTSGGVTEISEGDTITGATSAATAVITRVVLQSGSWAGGDAAGYFIFASQTGTFQSENLNVGASPNLATIAGDSSAITLTAGGTYRFHNENFFGASDLFRMYGVNGVNRAFEFDGTVFVPITTGMTVDTPFLVTVHKRQLFLGFPGGSLQHAGPGDPYAWAVILGAAELGIGEELTDLLSDVAGVLVIFGQNKISILYGNDVSDWDLRPFSDDSGAIAGTAQKIGAAVYVDGLGVRSLVTTQAYGDFQLGTITRLVEPLFRIKRKAGRTIVASYRVRAKDTYRFIWSDSSGLSVYFGKKTPEVMPFFLGKIITCAVSGEDANGNEIMFVGDDEGWVYQMDVGTSFDGAAVPAFIRLPFNHLGSPTQNKRFHKAILEATVPDPSIVIYLVPDFSYGNTDQPAGIEVLLDMEGGGGFWDTAIWDQFYWSQQVEGLGEAHIDGIGTNMSLAILSDAIYEQPHIIHGLTLHYSMRGLLR